LLLSSVLFPLLLLGAVAVFDRTLTFRAAEREMLATLDTLHGHAEKVFEFQTLMLGAVVERLRSTTGEEVRRDAAAHHAYLRALQGHTGGALGLAVFGADGRPVFDSDRFPAPGGVDVSDRDYFRWHRDNPGSEPFVSALFRSRAADGAPTFFVSVPWRGADSGNGFAGVMATGIRQTSFGEYWARAVPDPDAAVVLFRRDGTVLARRPAVDPDDRVRLSPEAPLMRSIAAGLERTVVPGVSQIDGKERLLAYRRLDRFPEVVIAHGVATSAVLLPWRGRLAGYATLAAAAALALSSLVLLARRRTAALIGEVAERRRAETEVRDLAGTLERRVAERTAEVRAGEAKFRGLLENSPEKMWVNKPDGSIEWLNAACRAYTGLAAVPARTEWAEVVHAEDLGHMLSLRDRAVATGHSYDVEVRLRRASDGAWRWHLAKVAPIRDGAGGIGTWVGTSVDIHDIREAEARLRDSEARLRREAERVDLALAAGAIIGTWDWDLPGDRFTVDERFAFYFGVDPALGRTGLSLEQVIATVHPDDLAGLRGAIAEVIGRGGAYAHQYRVRGRDGIYRWIEANGRVDLGAEGTPLRFPGVLLDVEARRTLEAERDRASALLRAFVAAVPGVVYAKDREGRMLVANEGLAAVFGQPLGTILGRTDPEFLDDPHQAAAVVAVDRRVMESGSPEQVEEVVSLPDGTPRVWLSTKAAFRNDAGEVVGLVGSSVDITERKQAEAALRGSEAALRRLAEDLERRVQERTARLAEANGELEAFAHSVAHDLRAPLRTMQGFAAALDEDYAAALDELGRDYLARIMRGAGRLDELIRDLLAYSRITREEIEMGRVDLDSLATEVFGQLRAAIEEKHALVVVEGPLPPVLGHRVVLSQALLNLVSNAMKFVEPNIRPEVRIQAEARSGGRLRLWVEDNGIGIAPEHAARIFEVFQRLHGSEEYPGTGIGLAIVRRGAERLGGSAGVESVPGQGSRFWIELQAAPDGEG
jgi:PAS domain S-box-containing protein